MGRAFTLVELLVVLAIAAALMGIILPSLTWARRLTQETRSLTNLRSHAAVMSTYAGDERDFFPFFTDPSAPISIVRGGGVAFPIPHFQSFFTWNVALADAYLGGDPLPESLRIPWETPRQALTMYWYGDCFIARPEFWRHDTRMSGTSQWRGTSLAEVAFPASKGLVLEQGWLPEVRGRQFGTNPRFCSADGSARQFATADIRRALQTGVGWGNEGHHWGLMVMHTVGGVQGRDVR